MMTTLPSLATSMFAFAVLVLTGAANAAPILLNSTQFAAAAGGSAMVEDFEGFPTGPKSNPFAFSNGRFTSDTPSIIDIAVLGPTQRLVEETASSAPRTFDLFPDGSTLVGFDIFYLDSADVFDIMVFGGSGVLNLIGQTGTSLGTFLGFQDPLGIASISIDNRGTGSSRSNFSFDNFQTAQQQGGGGTVAVPEPSSLGLAAWSLLGLAAGRYALRRKGFPATVQAVTRPTAA